MNLFKVFERLASTLHSNCRITYTFLFFYVCDNICTHGQCTEESKTFDDFGSHEAAATRSSYSSGRYFAGVLAVFSRYIMA